MSELKIQLKCAGPPGTYRQTAGVRVVGSTIIATLPTFALKAPRPAVHVSDDG